MGPGNPASTIAYTTSGQRLDPGYNPGLRHMTMLRYAKAESTLPGPMVCPYKRSPSGTGAHLKLQAIPQFASNFVIFEFIASKFSGFP